jgi:prefoldin subunit 5
MSDPKDIQNLRQLRKHLSQLQNALNITIEDVKSTKQKVDELLVAAGKKAAPVSSKRLTHQQYVNKFLA